MTSKAVDGVSLTVLGVGSVLIYAGIRGYSALAVVQNLVTGKPITTNVTVANPLQAGNQQSVGTTVNDIVSTTVTGSAQAIGKSLAANEGWTGAEWNALQSLWQHESNWNPKAKNPSSGAYGIPQALPYNKMPQAAWPESAGGKSDAATQIQWGLDYIKSRYGSPSVAWATWQSRSPHWY